LLALGSAALYGAADFLGGLASRRASTIAIVVASQAAGLLPLGLLVVLLPSAPSVRDFVWGAVAGLAGSAGVALLYRALAIGTMSIVAPTTAVCAVMLPVLVEALMGERLPAVTTIGIAMAIVAIVLVSRPGPLGPGSVAGPKGPALRLPRGLPRGIGLAFISGVAIGLFFLALARTGASAGLWPLLASRTLSIVLFGTAALAGGRSLRMPRPVMKIALACGMVDMLANALYILATRGASLSVVVTLASLYPASTVVLARIVLRERLSRTQAIGIACALVAVVLIVSSS
jgi:drug/metabolite transporter (DMT)-like permease